MEKIENFQKIENTKKYGKRLKIFKKTNFQNFDTTREEHGFAL